MRFNDVWIALLATSTSLEQVYASHMQGFSNANRGNESFPYKR